MSNVYYPMKTTVTSTSGHMGTPSTCRAPVLIPRSDGGGNHLSSCKPSVTYILSPSDWYSDINIIINKRYQVLKLTSHLSSLRPH